MRRLVLLLSVIAPLAADAQVRRASRDVVPRDVQRQVEDRWNGKNELRSRDSVYIAKDSRPVEGNVAVQNGPLVVGGRVNGSVLAVNSDVILRPGARIDGDVWVVGGRLRGRQNATIGGELRIYEARVVTRREGESLYIESEDDRDPPRTYRRRSTRYGGMAEPIHIATAGAYNRVEGLPINIGPSLYQTAPWGSLKIDAFAVVRTGSTFDSDGGDIGHDVTAELRLGRRTGPALGGRVFNTIDPVESWQLSETEASLAAFLFRRDYRDYFANRGVTGYGRLYVGPNASLTGSFSDQRWDTRDNLFNPFTIFRGDATWRPNPATDAGRLHVSNATLRYDSRTDRDAPRSGLFVVIDAEHGQGRLTSVAPSSQPRPYASGDAIEYNRGFIDARSYHVLSPNGQINFRVVGGGWISGDALPMQRRLSVEGSSALPGFDFREDTPGFSAGTCSNGPATPFGRPAECDRIALAQVEYRGSLNIDIGDWREDAGRYIGARGDASWVMFFDAGRGWMVGNPTADESTYPNDELPSVNSFRSDVGIGFDIGGLGVYAAKSISRPEESVNFFLRLNRRF